MGAGPDSRGPEYCGHPALSREVARAWGGQPRSRAHICNSLLSWLGRLRRLGREPGTSAGTKGHCAFFFP